MQYRTFGKLDWKPSALGFGAMRLPTIGGESAQIDEQEATRMVRYAIDHGVNYVDTAYGYHRGESEKFLSRALQDGYREKIKLATKLPMWLVKATEDFDRYLDEQLEKLQTDHIDFYLFHGLRNERWSVVKEQQLLGEAENALADGRIRHLGFSFHDEFEVFKKIIDGYDSWTMCQIQYNYMDIEHQAGTRGLQYAADKGLAVVIMEPIRGGRLAADPPPDPIMKLWKSASHQRTPAEWALQWVWNQPEVSVVLSGMSTMEHVVENVESADRSGPGTLSHEELELIARVRDTYRELAPIDCTACEYCLPCPNGVNIPRIFSIFNEAIMYNELRSARNAYKWLEAEARADVCEQCGECVELCPQGIPISDWLEKAHALLSEAVAT
jgi:predicted aldo/keto reductase-like oxidoreductase